MRHKSLQSEPLFRSGLKRQTSRIIRVSLCSARFQYPLWHDHQADPLIDAAAPQDGAIAKSKIVDGGAQTPHV